MKKLILAVAFLAFGFANGQDTKYGVKAGVDFYSSKVTVTLPFGLGTQTATASGTGFYVGGFANFPMSEKFAFQPELAYVSVEGGGFLNLPILANYTVVEKIHLLAGPSLNYFLDAEEDQFKLNVDFGGAYDITEKIDLNARYSLGFGDVAFNGIFVGANYKF